MWIKGIRERSEVQIKLVAAAIASKYKYLKTDEMMLFFFNFKAGFYERFFCYFDPQTIIKSMPTFLQERQQIIEFHERELQKVMTKKDQVPCLSIEEINKH